MSDWLRGVRGPKFLTLTTRHTHRPLADQVAALYKHFRLFRQHKQISRVIRGGIWFFQLKRSSKRSEWHPHLHCVLDANYISQRLLSTEWQLTTGDSFIVDIRAVKDSRKVAEYVSRYCSKPANLSDFTKEDGLEVFSVFHGKRLCGSFGSGRSIHLTPRKCEDVDQWQRLRSWSYVITHQSCDAGCRAALKSFLTGKSVEFSSVESLIEQLPDEQCLHPGSRTQIEDEQMLFKEFK